MLDGLSHSSVTQFNLSKSILGSKRHYSTSFSFPDVCMLKNGGKCLSVCACWQVHFCSSFFLMCLPSSFVGALPLKSVNRLFKHSFLVNSKAWLPAPLPHRSGFTSLLLSPVWKCPGLLYFPAKYSYPSFPEWSHGFHSSGDFLKKYNSTLKEVFRGLP